MAFYLRRAIVYIEKMIMLIKSCHSFEEVQQRHELIKRRLGLICATFEQIAQTIDAEGALNRTGRLPFSKVSVHGGAGEDKASLWSQNLLKAMKYAKDLGGKTIGFSGFDGGPMGRMADVCIVVPIDSTPHVESFHLALEHLICSCLKDRIAKS